MILLPFKIMKLTKAFLAALFAAALTFAYAVPVAAKNSVDGAKRNSDTGVAAIGMASAQQLGNGGSGAPDAKLREALNRLNPSLSMWIDDADAAMELGKSMTTGLEFSGVKSWSYEGIQDGERIRLTWALEWFDEHAVLSAYQDPALKAKLTEKQKKLLKKCEGILSEIIKPGMTDYEKQVKIHDYIVLNCAYDGALARSGNATGTEDSFFAYGALINGKAVCGGYVEAAKLLLDMVGIENYRLNSAEHSWSLVKINGGYYHMDITWNDPEPNVRGRVLYDYFNLTDAQVMEFKSHDWLYKDLYPKATATKHNYFVYNNLVANNYGEVKRLLLDAAAAGKGEITILVTDYETGGYKWENDLKFLHGLVSMDSMITKYSYSPPNQDKPTLTVRFGH